jgi:hypothetical protein
MVGVATRASKRTEWGQSEHEPVGDTAGWVPSVKLW